jgi:hypothetical protein
MITESWINVFTLKATFVIWGTILTSFYQEEGGKRPADSPSQSLAPR